MKNIGLLIGASLIINTFTIAQSVTGNARLNASESVALKKMRYGNVQAFDRNNNLVNSILTDDEGNYKMDFKDTGTYHIKVMYAGYETIEETISVTEDEVSNFSLEKDADKKERVLEEKAYALETRYMGGKAILSQHNAKVNNVAEGEGLTAGEINDFAKWELWKDYLKTELSKYQNLWKLNPQQRYTVQLVNKNRNPLVGATVKLFAASGTVLWECLSDNTGKAELWGKLTNESKEIGKIEVTHQGITKTIKRPKPFEKGINKLKFDVDCGTNSNEVEIAFLIDATGSMGDEINFIKRDLNKVMYAAQNLYKEVNIKYGSVFYRDNSEAYITKHQDFTNVLSQALVFIDEQTAAGGGDMPEALDDGMEVALEKLSWTNSARTKLLFVVLDAPAHSKPENLERLERLARNAAKKGIRIVPITGSGMNKSGEYLMRSLALATNGTYLFLTDHSGIGVSHIKPTIDEYDVQLLTERLTSVIKSAIYYPKCEEITPLFEMNYPDSVVNFTLEEGQIITEDSLANETPDRTNREDSTLRDRTGLNQIEWRFYPNPTRDYVTVEVTGEIEFVYLTDLTGKLLKRVEFNGSNREQIYLGDYPVGIYLLRYPVGKQWVTGKVVLMR